MIVFGGISHPDQVHIVVIYPVNSIPGYSCGGWSNIRRNRFIGLGAFRYQVNDDGIAAVAIVAGYTVGYRIDPGSDRSRLIWPV